MNASSNDNKLFHQLVQIQRHSTGNGTNVMYFDGKETESNEDILEEWKEYFENLYKDESECNALNRLQLAKIQNEIIEEIEISKNEKLKHVSVEEITKTILKLKTGKSPGHDGLSAEHLKNMPPELLPYICDIINTIIDTKTISKSLKKGILTPVTKPGKDAKYPENYRGITVTTTLSTILEGILKDRIEPILVKTQNQMQRGFTQHSSSLNTAFIISQAIEHYKEHQNDLFLVTLDAQKAFDRVNHDIMMNKLYHDGIQGDMWLLLKNLYTEVSVNVKWNGDLTSEFYQEQGVRQGSKLSTVLYKRYNNDILNALERSNLGASIGNIRVVAPTCADDIAILAPNEHEAQALLDIVNDCTKKDNVRINPCKLEVVPLVKTSTKINVQLGHESIDQKTSTKHFGIIRDDINNFNTDERLKSARNTLYALLGPGLNVRNGMSPCVITKLWKTYIIPKLLYGIEVLSYQQKDIKKLEAFQMKILKQVQSLPQRTANIGVYILLGMEPVHSVIDRQTLTFLVNQLQDNTTLEYKIIERQSGMSDGKIQTFLNRIRVLLKKYNLPSVEQLLKNTPKKEEWKRTVNKAINDNLTATFTEEKASKKTLEELDVQDPPVGKVHPIWQLAPNNTREIRKSEVKAKLITKTYTLQSDRAKFTNGKESNICPLCNKEPENSEHFILKCEATSEERAKHITTLKLYLDEIKGTDCYQNIIQNNLLMKLVLDPSSTKLNPFLGPIKKSNYQKLESITRTLCYSIHLKRALMLNMKKH